MKFTSDTRTLLHALEQAKAAVPAHPTLVAYSAVMIQVRKKQVELVGSDGDTVVSAAFTATGTVDGVVFIPPGPLYTFLRGAGDRHVNVELIDDVVVSCDGLGAYHFRPVTTSFPNPTIAKGTARALNLDRLRQGLDAVRHAAGKDLGVLLQSRKDQLVLYGTDHYRLHSATLQGCGFGEFTGAFPVSLLQQVCDLNPKEVLVDDRSRTLTFRTARSFITTRTLAGDYPRVESVMEHTSIVTLQVSTGDMRSALGRLSAVADGDPVNVRSHNGCLVLTVDNPERGSGSELVPCRGDGDIQFLADRGFLAEALAAHGTEDVTIHWATAIGPVFIRSGGADEVVTVIMPIRSA